MFASHIQGELSSSEAKRLMLCAALLRTIHMVLPDECEVEDEPQMFKFVYLVYNREVLQTESGSIFGKVRVKVLAGHGQSTHEDVRTESLFCKTE